MPTVLTLVSPADEDSAALAMENHGAYCARHGYTHLVERFSHAQPRALSQMRVVHSAKRALRAVPEGDLLMVATYESTVYRDIPLERLMAGRDFLATLTRTAPEDPPPEAQMNWFVLRNSPAGRAAISRAIIGTHHRNLHFRDATGETAFEALKPLPYYTQVDGVHLNINWHTDQDSWRHAVIFIVNTMRWTRHFLDGQLHPDILSDPRFLQVVRREVAAAFAGRDLPVAPGSPALPGAPYEAFQPGGRIAFVTMHTKEISDYARVAEPNLRRYCARQGYAMHAYRRVPEWLDGSVNGTWHKADLLLRHFEQHEWVIWIDADILVLDPAQAMEPLLEGREVLAAKDIGGWPFNAGLLGFRRTARNRDAIEEVRRRLHDVQDKSTVYTNGGDQPHWIRVLMDTGMCDDTTVYDLLTLNTPHIFAGPDSFMVHYMGLPNRYRAQYMADDDARSQRRFPHP